MTKGLDFTLDAMKCIIELKQLDGIVAKIETYTVNDLRKWLPGHVSTAVTKVYRIKKSEVVASHAKIATGKGGFRRSRNAKNAQVQASYGGYKFDNFEVVFRGRVSATWMTKAKPKPKPTSNGAFSSKRPYSVTQEVIRGHKPIITPSAGHRVFVMKIGGMMRPMVVGRDEIPKVHGVSSVPHAIFNGRVVAIWKPQMNDYILRRFNHHAKHFWSGSAYIRYKDDRRLTKYKR